MKTQSVNKESVSHNWYVVDAGGKTLGRLSTQIANRLRGKHKPEFTPHVDTGDYIVVVNADKIHVTGKKETDKLYYHHTGFPGGIKSIALGKMRKKSPEKILERIETIPKHLHDNELLSVEQSLLLNRFHHASNLRPVRD